MLSGDGSGRKKKRKTSTGVFTPSQFSSCLEGLNIYAHVRNNGNEQTIGGKKNTDPADGENADSDTESKKPSAVGNLKRSVKERIFPSVCSAQPEHEGATSSTPPVECTNGALEALRVCHSEFLAAVTSALALESESNSGGGRSEGRGDDVDCGSGIRHLNERHVLACMENLGFSELASRAVESCSDGVVDNQETTRSNAGAKAKKRSRKRRGKPFSGFGGTTEELLAEQERLLAESARKMRDQQAPP